MGFIYYLSLIGFIFICALFCFVVLVQESRTMGLGASFGGETSNSLFGTSTADVLKKFTAYLAVIFVALCLILSLWTAALGRSSSDLPTDEVIEKAAE